ncbi:hypothetical protein, partial, partial [Absidia glauca]
SASSSSSAMAIEATILDNDTNERNANEVIDLVSDSDEEEAFAFDFDYDDDASMDSVNSHFTRTDVMTEPKEYDSNYFGTMPTDTASNISGMLYNLAQQFNIPREAYATIIDLINDKVIPAAGN